MKLRAEFAKSSRARCRACGKMIQGGTIRWAKENEEDDIRPQYTHLSCLNLAKATRENLTEKDIIFDADLTKKQRDAIVEAFHLTAEEEPEQRRMEAVKRHEVAPEKRKDKPDYMEDEGENEGETEEKKEQEEDEDDEEYVEEEGDEDEKEEADEEEYMEEDEIEGDLEEVKAEAAEFQQPNKRRKKNEETEQKGASEEKASGTRQKTRASGRTQKSKTGEGDQGSEGERSDEEQEEKGSEDAKQTKETKGGRNDKNQESAAKKYENMGSDELKEYLRANKQIMSGTQEDLRKRCIDCELYGALPTCPQCQKGRLIKNEQTGKVECHGYYDEDAGMPAKCGFNEDEKKIQRRPWREPSEAPPVLFNVHIKGEEGPASLTAEVKKKLDSIVGSKNLNKRDTARELMKYGRESELELPKDDDEAIDAIEEHLDEHTENSNIDYEAAFAEIAREYSKDPEIKGMRKSKSRFDKNEKIADALNELATLYGKLGGQDRFRARAEKKAAGAVRSLDFEIRSGKELSEGDTKIEGIGHDTGEMIDEFLQTGKIEKLEDARKRVQEQKSE